MKGTLTGDFAQVEDMVATHELVIAVWPDPAARRGVRTRVVKGESVLNTIINADRAVETSWTAIPCTSPEQAEALRQAPPKPANDRYGVRRI